MKKITVCLLGTALLLSCASTASAQTYRSYKQKARKQWFAISVDRINSTPLHIKNAPLQQLVGRDLGTSQRKEWDYESRDDGGLTRVDVLEYKRDTKGFGLSLYPFGSAQGASLMLRGSFETLPVFRAEIEGPSNVNHYEFLDGKAYDAGIGVMVADRAPGWGLGSHAFAVAGIGKVDSNIGTGSRVFGEGGGGLNIGPIGVELGVKFAYNKMKSPIEHGFYTVPVTLRVTFGF